MRIIFAGTPEFAVPGLTALISSGHDLAAVYTQPDRPAGRGRRLQASPVKQLAMTHGIAVRQPESLKRDRAAVAALRDLNADLMVVIAYGLLLPTGVLRAPRLGCLNVHASLLPRWRGAAPIQRALLAGDPHSGVCIMGMEAGLDTGSVYHRISIPLDPRETGGGLHDKLAALGACALLEALPGINDGSRAAAPQDPALATYAHKLSKEESTIDWNQGAATIERQVRAFDPWPVAQTRLHDQSLRIWSAQVADAPTTGFAPGTVVSADRTGIRVATGAGLLTITRLQLPGKRPMDAADFLNARPLQGVCFG